MGLTRDPELDLGVSYENVSFPNFVDHEFSRGPYNISAWHIAGTQTTGLVLVHGGGHDRREHMRLVNFLTKEGYPLLMIDLSEHGISTGARRGLNFGHRERFDVVGASIYAHQTLKWKRVVVLGTSVGAVSSILAATTTVPNAPLHGQVNTYIDGVIAENPFYSPEALFVHAIHRVLYNAYPGRDLSKFGPVAHILASVVHYIPKSYWTYVAHFVQYRVKYPGDASALEQAHLIHPRPLFLMHGHLDEVVPHDHSEQLFAAAGANKKLWLTSEGKHAVLYNLYPELYTQHVLKFLADLESATPLDGSIVRTE